MKKELRAYIAAYVWMDVYLEKEVKDIWNTDPAKGLIHDIVRQHISLKHWEQIDRFFYASKPLPQGQKTPFDKPKPLSEHLRKKFKDYWHTGAHLAVDETTQRLNDSWVVPKRPSICPQSLYLRASISGLLPIMAMFLTGSTMPKATTEGR